MKRFLFVLMTFFFLFGAVLSYRADGKKPPQESTYHALIIGNNQYKYLRPLKTAKNDAVEVERLLKDKFHFKTELLLDATRADILDRINGLRKRLRKEDNLLIYYAGHGDYKKEAEKAYWLPVDAQRDNNTNWIIVDDITSNIKMIASRHILVISDSCYSGTLARQAITELLTGEREEYLKKMVGRPSRTLMASGGNEPVSDSGGGNNSVFADAFLKSLKETGKDAFTAQEIFPRIKEIVAGRSDQIPEYSNIRNSGHDGGDFVFVLPKQIAGLKVQEREEKDKFSIDDLEKIDKADRATWNTKLKNMKTAFEKAEQFEKKKRAPGLKVEAWQRFLETFQEKNPYSDEDTRLREKAGERIKHWRAEKETLAGGKARLEAEKKQEEERRKQAEEQKQLEDQKKMEEGRHRIQREKQRLEEEKKKAEEPASMTTRPIEMPEEPQKRITNSIGMEFVLIQAGSFVMGSPGGSGDEDGFPLHNVSITKPFYLQTKEVTQQQWSKIMRVNPSHFKGDPERPVEMVSWDDIQEFIKLLNSKENNNSYRLPTEAEWEYACRAGRKGKWSFGDDQSRLEQYAWFKNNSKKTTHPAGMKSPNAWGLYDMGGNVWEWCADYYTWDRTTTAQTQDPFVNEYPRNDVYGNKNKYRTMRGGGLWSDSETLQCAHRTTFSVMRNEEKSEDVGFRLVQSVGPAKAYKQKQNEKITNGLPGTVDPKGNTGQPEAYPIKRPGERGE